jgi:hypothetical protein
MPDRRITPKRKVIGLTCLLFLLACLLPCIDCGPEVPSSDPGWPDFESGWHFGLTILLLGSDGGNNGVPWSANVFLALGLICLVYPKPRAAAVCGVIASVLGLTTWWVRRDDVLLVGFYAWQASLFALAGGAIRMIRTTAGQSETMDSLPAHERWLRAANGCEAT